MRLSTVSLGGSFNNQDRYVVTGTPEDMVLVVLDGATAFEPNHLDAGVYAEFLGESVAHRLDGDSAVTIPEAVASAISQTSEHLGLAPERSPSSTVSVLRTRSGAVDLYALGDSPIHYGADDTHYVLIDERIDSVGTRERSIYRDRLRAGHGFDDEHRKCLKDLQRKQRSARNRSDGYWIAETAPEAGHHGITLTVHPSTITWAVLATDGAADLIDHLGDSWPEIAGLDLEDFPPLLQSLHAWEEQIDPDGRQLPRAKRHDDKTIVAVRFGQ